jgi:hypothetical protein
MHVLCLGMRELSLKLEYVNPIVFSPARKLMPLVYCHVEIEEHDKR